MRNIWFLILLVSLVQINALGQKNTITYEGNEYFINGLNVAWNKFGGDFGNHPWWGSMYDGDWWEEFFSDCEANGVNVIRVWIHCDGRASPEFDENGFCKGVDTDYFQDMDDMFRRAKQHNVLVMPCVWSFDMCKDFRESAGPGAGGHHDLLTDDAKMDSYLDNCFIPMVKRYANQCNLFAWEVCNEPEWALDRTSEGDTSWTYSTGETVPFESMQKLTAKMTAAVHKYSDKMVTTGSASMRWNSDVAPAVGNRWSDAALQAQFNDPGAYLDFYQVHFYEYMIKQGGDLYNPEMPLSYWEVDKPVIIGETPADTGYCQQYSVDYVMDQAYKAGYAGIMYWSYNGDDGVGKWSDFKNTLKRFRAEHKDIVEPAPCPCLKLPLEDIALKHEKSGSKWNLSWKAADALILASHTFEYSTDGKTFKKSKTINSKGWETEEYSAKLKIKEEGDLWMRVVEKDVFGYERTSDAFRLN